MSESSLNSEKDLSIDAERLVARTFIGRIEWEMIVIGLGQFVVWLGIWYAVLIGSVSYTHLTLPTSG